MMFISVEGSVEDPDPYFIAQLISCCVNRIAKDMPNTPLWHERDGLYLNWDIDEDGVLLMSFSEALTPHETQMMQFDLDLSVCYPTSLITGAIQQMLTDRGWDYQNVTDGLGPNHLMLTAAVP